MGRRRLLLLHKDMHTTKMLDTFVPSIEVLFKRLFLVLKDFLFAEESADFCFCSFRSVGCVSDVDHHVDAEFIAQCSGGSLLGVCGSEHFADFCDGVFAFEHESDDRLAAHERFDFRIERFVCNVCVVFAENRRIEAKHFTAAQCETCFFEASNHFAADLFFDCVGFQENEGAFVHSGIWVRVKCR